MEEKCRRVNLVRDSDYSVNKFAICLNCSALRMRPPSAWPCCLHPKKKNTNNNKNKRANVTYTQNFINIIVELTNFFSSYLTSLLILFFYLLLTICQINKYEFFFFIFLLLLKCKLRHLTLTKIYISFLTLLLLN